RRGGSGKPRPQWHEEYLSLPQSIADYLTAQRALTPDTLRQARVTGQWELMPGGPGEEPEAVIGFNYFEDGQLVNVKYRTLDKRFKMVTGAELIPYRIDAIASQPVCYITEGEIDTLTLVQCGFPETISVPSGGSSKLDWMDRFVESHFEDKQRVVLAMDDDPVGRALTAELVRRLGAERCYLVRWSEGCKDANDQLVQHGAESVAACVNGAEEVPIEGIFIVTSPQELVSMVVAKAVNMANLMNVPIVGLIENMSYFKCPDCGKEYKIFGDSHISEIADANGLDVLARIPIDPELAKVCDAGAVELFEGDYLAGAVTRLLDGKK
ncbi:MAG: P-loop NTPase, partial [Eubacteriales bacterium]